LIISTLIALSFASPAFAVSGPALQFVPAPPCRVADTRNPVGPFGGPPITGGTSREFVIPASACNIPYDAAAYSLNLTVVPHGPLGFLTIWPSGQTQPLASTLNSFDGRTKANAVVVGAGNDTGVSVYASGTTDVVLDINGYFISSNSAGLTFYTLPPCRVLDTRNPDGPLGGPYLKANSARTFPLLMSSCNIPSAAQAYSLNVTAVPRGPLYFLSVWPAGQAWPGISTLNASTWTAVANGATVPAGTGGGIQALASNDTDMLVDINGYFAPSGMGGLSLFPTSPCRVLDTRNGVGNFKGELTINVVGSPCGIPSAAQSYVLNATVVPPGSLGFLSLWPDGQNQPLVSTLNAYDGAVTSNLAIVPTTNGKIDAYASDLTPLILDISSYFAPQTYITILPQTLPTGAKNTYYLYQVAAIGGIAPYTWSVTKGGLPTGLTLDPGSGTILGLPGATGTFPFTVQVKDSQSDVATVDLSITIEATPVVINTNALPVGNVNAAYSTTLSASGGTAPYTWSLNYGFLPPGISLNAASGVLSGDPSATGSYDFIVQVQDKVGFIVSQELTIIVGSGAGNAMLSGTYAYSFSGYNVFAGAARFNLGSFVADGLGKITSGFFDYNGSDQTPGTVTIPNGQYSIEANGLGVLSYSNGSGYINAAVALSSNGDLRIIRFLNANSTGVFASGIVAKQDTSKFSLADLTGPFAFGSHGVDGGLNPFASAGVFTLTGTINVSNGEIDLDDNGLSQNTTFTGTLGAMVNTTTGRGTMTLNIGAGTVHMVFYVVSANRLLMMAIDPIQNNSLFSGSAASQTGPFTNASLSGNSILEAPGIEIMNMAPNPAITVGLVTSNGMGTASAVLDSNNGGVISQVTFTNGTYSVGMNGRVTLNGFGKHPPVFYLTNPNRGYQVGTDTPAVSGFLEPQTGSNFTNASLSGNYLGGSVAPVANAADANLVAADGNGNLSITDYSFDLSQEMFSGTYAVSSSGRTIVYDNNNVQAAIGYVVSPTKFVIMTVDPVSGEMVSAEH
jgi:hypothetical protein